MEICPELKDRCWLALIMHRQLHRLALILQHLLVPPLLLQLKETLVLRRHLSQDRETLVFRLFNKLIDHLNLK